MKAKFRIKLMQEKTRAKNLTDVLNKCDNKQAYQLRLIRDKLDDKIEFYKMMNRIIEESEKK